MRTAVAIATCLVAGLAFADADIKVKPIRMEVGAAAPAEETDARGDTGSSNATRAQDYNSSRSNTTSLRQPDDPILRKRPGRTTAADAASHAGQPTSRGVAARDYNSSRSNNINGVADNDGDSDPAPDRCKRAIGDGVDDDCDGLRGATARG